MVCLYWKGQPRECLADTLWSIHLQFKGNLLRSQLWHFCGWQIHCDWIWRQEGNRLRGLVLRTIWRCEESVYLPYQDDQLEQAAQGDKQVNIGIRTADSECPFLRQGTETRTPRLFKRTVWILWRGSYPRYWHEKAQGFLVKTFDSSFYARIKCPMGLLRFETPFNWTWKVRVFL